MFNKTIFFITILFVQNSLQGCYHTPAALFMDKENRVQMKKDLAFLTHIRPALVRLARSKNINDLYKVCGNLNQLNTIYFENNPRSLVHYHNYFAVDRLPRVAQEQYETGQMTWPAVLKSCGNIVDDVDHIKNNFDSALQFLPVKTTSRDRKKMRKKFGYMPPARQAD